MSVPDWLDEVIASVEDFPIEGITFRDLSPLWASPSAMSRMTIGLADGATPTAVVGVEARGFIVGTALAQRLGVPFVAVRKPGKLPGETVGVDYGLEYGTDRLELQAGALGADDTVVIADDVLATGGTAAAAVELVRGTGASVASVRVVLELDGLDGRARLAAAAGGPVDVVALGSVDA